MFSCVLDKNSTLQLQVSHLEIKNSSNNPGSSVFYVDHNYVGSIMSIELPSYSAKTEVELSKALERNTGRKLKFCQGGRTGFSHHQKREKKGYHL